MDERGCCCSGSSADCCCSGYGGGTICGSEFGLEE